MKKKSQDDLPPECLEALYDAARKGSPVSPCNPNDDSAFIRAMAPPHKTDPRAVKAERKRIERALTALREPETIEALQDGNINGPVWNRLKLCLSFSEGLRAQRERYSDAMQDIYDAGRKSVSEFKKIVERLEPAAKAGRKVFDVQAQRRAEWSRRRRADWATWQAWIDEQRRVKKWGFTFAQRQAENHFKVSLKSIRRRTHETGTG